jgi:hypothetical protein
MVGTPQKDDAGTDALEAIPSILGTSLRAFSSSDIESHLEIPPPSGAGQPLRQQPFGAVNGSHAVAPLAVNPAGMTLASSAFLHAVAFLQTLRLRDLIEVPRTIDVVLHSTRNDRASRQ